MKTLNNCAAVVQLGKETRYFEGDDFFDILNKMMEYQNFNSLIEQLRSSGVDGDVKMADRIQDWLFNLKGNPGDMHRFDQMDFPVSNGIFKCLGWARDEEGRKALREEFKID